MGQFCNINETCLKMTLPGKKSTTSTAAFYNIYVESRTSSCWMQHLRCSSKHRVCRFDSVEISNCFAFYLTREAAATRGPSLTD